MLPRNWRLQGEPGTVVNQPSLPQSRQELEQHSVDTASTSDAVTFITYVQSLKRKIKQFEKQVEVSSHVGLLTKLLMSCALMEH